MQGVVTRSTECRTLGIMALTVRRTSRPPPSLVHLYFPLSQSASAMPAGHGKPHRTRQLRRISILADEDADVISNLVRKCVQSILEVQAGKQDGRFEVVLRHHRTCKRLQRLPAVALPRCAVVQDHQTRWVERYCPEIAMTHAVPKAGTIPLYHLESYVTKGQEPVSMWANA